MINLIKEKASSMMAGQNFDYLSAGVIDFKSSSFETFSLYKEDETKESLYFDLASLSKTLNLASSYHLRPDLFTEDMVLLLEHQSGLPSWGLLSKSDWKEQLLKYKIGKSSTLYSDYGALRLMLEIDKRSEEGLRGIASSFWDKELLFWKDLSKDFLFPPTGLRNKSIIKGIVHDPNAFVIDEFVSHAGLFGTIKGVCSSYLNLNEKTSFFSRVLEKKKKNEEQRFILGWDTVSTLKGSLAGDGHSLETFGHLGFTGTSIWIDPIREVGFALLTNATKNYWHERAGLQKMRRSLGEIVWKES